MPTIVELMREAVRRRNLESDRKAYWDGYIEGLFRVRNNYHFHSDVDSPFSSRIEPVACALDGEDVQARAGYLDGWNIGLLADRGPWYRPIWRPPPPPENDGPAAA